jgi:hypothetical protein
MSAQWPRDRVLRELVSRCGLPDGAKVEVGRHGGLVYVDSGLVRRLRVRAAPPGKLHWEVDVGDEVLSRPDSAAFHTTYAIDDALVGGHDRRRDSRNWTGYPWPTTGADLDDQLVEDVRQFAPRMLWFLGDRRELGLMMLRGDETPASSAVWRDGAVLVLDAVDRPAFVLDLEQVRRQELVLDAGQIISAAEKEVRLAQGLGAAGSRAVGLPW